MDIAPIHSHPTILYVIIVVVFSGQQHWIRQIWVTLGVGSSRQTTE